MTFNDILALILFVFISSCSTVEDIGKDVGEAFVNNVSGISTKVQNSSTEYRWGWVSSEEYDQQRLGVELSSNKLLNSLFKTEDPWLRCVEFFVDWGFQATLDLSQNSNDDDPELDGEDIGVFGFGTRITTPMKPSEMGFEGELRLAYHELSEDEGNWKYEMDGSEYNIMIGPYYAVDFYDVIPKLRLGALYQRHEGDYTYREYDSVAGAWNKMTDEYRSSSPSLYIGVQLPGFSVEKTYEKKKSVFLKADLLFFKNVYIDDLQGIAFSLGVEF